MGMFREKKEEIILRLFSMTEKPEIWEAYLPLKEDERFLLVRLVCSKCGKPWRLDRKECFFCKSRYYRVKVCPKCNSLYAENVASCSQCEEDGKRTRTVKMCINCGEIEKDRHKVFVPITFCWFCGNRENEFEWKKEKL